MNNFPEQPISFVEHLAASQNRLYGYIFSLVNNHHQAADILQETNLALWRKADQFDANRQFIPWAFTFARFQVMASQRDLKRDRLLLDPDVLEMVATELGEEAAGFDDLQMALRQCLTKLPEKSRSLIEARYFGGCSIDQLCARMSANASAIKVALLRIRRSLRQCIQVSMAAQQ